ncbi:MAG TPA: formylmethanofuran dehydrogenase subunit A [Archaeoglobaceae archaeon]|nr:formylmethanofuran dehydrogenase subunit A [Archaeoglobaceae archaeon]
MKLILKNGIVYDPMNGINGEKMDICIKDGRIVDKIWFGAKKIDVSNKLVMPGGFDIHAHIAGAKVNSGRTLRPEDSLRKFFMKKNGLRSGSGYSVPSTFLTGYEYTKMGYTTAITPAMPPLYARHTHHELNDIPIIDKMAFPLYDGNWFVMKYISEGDIEKLKAYVAWLLRTTKGFAIKIVNPGGTEAWGWRMNIEDIDEPVPHFNVTSREMIENLVRACESLKLPHSVHIHGNNLGNPGNFETALKTIDSIKHIEGKNDRQVLHLTHLQFFTYGGDSWKTFESRADEVAKLVNKRDVTIDTGNVVFGDTTTMTADGPLEYSLHTITRLKWVNRDVELETSPGITPIIYSKKSHVNAVQWAAGLELALLTEPEKVVLTTDHPNGGPFTRYPELIALLMSKKYREKVSVVNSAIDRRSSLLTIEKEYDFYEVAMITRANPAKAVGVEKIKGHLGKGAQADIAVYDINPLEFDPSDYQKIEKALSNAFLTIKEGEIVFKDGEIIKQFTGKTYWVNAKSDAEIEKDLKEFFKKYYSVSLPNYVIGLDEVARGEVISIN